MLARHRQVALALDLAQEGVDAPEVVLLEAAEERMIVALGALDLRAEEQRG